LASEFMNAPRPTRRPKLAPRRSTTNDVQRSEVTATGKKDASLASKQLQDKKSTTSAKSVAGSDLAQAKGKKKK
jgi:hypothetical protein